MFQSAEDCYLAFKVYVMHQIWWATYFCLPGWLPLCRRAKIAISLGSARTWVAVVSIKRDFIVSRRRISTFANTEVLVLLISRKIYSENSTHHPLVGGHRWLLLSAFLTLHKWILLRGQSSRRTGQTLFLCFVLWLETILASRTLLKRREIGRVRWSSGKTAEMQARVHCTNLSVLLLFSSLLVKLSVIISWKIIFFLVRWLWRQREGNNPHFFPKRKHAGDQSTSSTEWRSDYSLKRGILTCRVALLRTWILYTVFSSP